MNAFYKNPKPKNEKIRDYYPNSKEKTSVVKMYQKLKNSQIDIPMYIGNKKIKTKNKKTITPPHDHKHIIGYYNYGNRKHVKEAINNSLGVKQQWAELPWEERAAVFLKAADLLSGKYRDLLNASTMLCQSKNIYQAEIDAACELIDFFNFNVHFMTALYKNQPISEKGCWNRMEYRPLEGFVFAITPFNFTSIACNLPAVAALMGNVVIWKPADTQIYSAHVIMQLLHEAGLPKGVINMITLDGEEAGEVIFKHKAFAGLHFTGSTKVFQNLWKIIGNNIDKYNSYPRIVGETGGKDFIIAHKSANHKQVSTAITRGSFEFQGQKCSAASRAYIPKNLWPKIEKNIKNDLKTIKIGSPEDFSNFINAVIDEKSFDKIVKYIKYAKNSKKAKIIAGGNYNKKNGYFIEPTVIKTTDPKFKTMCEEIFGPVITIYVYEENKFENILKIIDETSPYALTGAVFSNDRYIINKVSRRLQNCAGNFYINDKPTGAVVGQQPFGGARKSGTNDKAGAVFNLLRWVSPRTIKENFNPPENYKYPFLG